MDNEKSPKGLEMKYFVLKPKGTNPYAKASRKAMVAYANEIGGENPKHQARLATKRGQIEKPLLCEECNEYKPFDRHHSDYEEPKKVKWLCRRCHSKKRSA